LTRRYDDDDIYDTFDGGDGTYFESDRLTFDLEDDGGGGDSGGGASAESSTDGSGYFFLTPEEAEAPATGLMTMMMDCLEGFVPADTAAASGGLLPAQGLTGGVGGAHQSAMDSVDRLMQMFPELEFGLIQTCFQQSGEDLDVTSNTLCDIINSGTGRGGAAVGVGGGSSGGIGGGKSGGTKGTLRRNAKARTNKAPPRPTTAPPPSPMPSESAEQKLLQSMRELVATEQSYVRMVHSHSHSHSDFDFPLALPTRISHSH
jgi:hypothetical protein